MAEMIHFVKQLQYFCHLEVIECSWVVLSSFIEKGEGDLDALIDAHTSYINQLASKALLRAVSRRGDIQEEETIMNNVKDAFKIALRFKDSLDALCNYALAEASRQSGPRSPDSVSIDMVTREIALTLVVPSFTIDFFACSVQRRRC